MKVGRRALLGLAVPLLALLLLWGWGRGAAAVRESRRERAALEARRAELERTTASLAREVASLKAESEARARAARETLGAVAEGEVVVIVQTPAVAQ